MAMRMLNRQQRTGAGIRALRESTGLMPRDFAALVGVNVFTLYRWELYAGKCPPPMSEASERVFWQLEAMPVKHRCEVARALRLQGWRAAWALLFAS